MANDNDLDFSDMFELFNESEFEEMPVGIPEFVTGENYLNSVPMSYYQYEIIKYATQIFKLETLIKLYGEEEGKKIWLGTVNEVIMMLGKGSGKDFTSTVACAYLVYLLLCLKDPAKYFGKPPGDAIDIINIAINSQQAKNVFFKGFLQRLGGSPWFQGRYTNTADAVKFDKSITVHSGHSQRESWEGYNVILVILDEISGFQMESTSGNDQAKTADAIYKMYRASVDSRFPDIGKLLLLSFPRFKGDFITERYNQVVAEKQVTIMEHQFIINPELADDAPNNKFTIHWEEDDIIAYAYPGVFALKRTTWDVNPMRQVGDFKTAFMNDPIDSLSRFACMPPEAVDAFFKSREKVENAFCQLRLMIDEMGNFHNDFKPKDDETRYFIHVDLAQKHDRCAVALAHIDSWVNIEYGSINSYQPIIVVDAVRYWTPTTDKSVEFDDVRDYIIELKRRGFWIVKATFDRWNSHQIMGELGQYGIHTEILSVAKKHYDDFQIAVNEERVSGPRIPILIDELLRLQIIRDKVDHPRSGGKDLSDAVCGAIYDAISGTPPEYSADIKVLTFGATIRTDADKARKEDERPKVEKPQEPMPEGLSDYFKGFVV